MPFENPFTLEDIEAVDGGDKEYVIRWQRKSLAILSKTQLTVETDAAPLCVVVLDREQNSVTLSDLYTTLGTAKKTIHDVSAVCGIMSLVDADIESDHRFDLVNDNDPNRFMDADCSLLRDGRKPLQAEFSCMTDDSRPAYSQPVKASRLLEMLMCRGEWKNTRDGYSYFSKGD